MKPNSPAFGLVAYGSDCSCFSRRGLFHWKGLPKWMSVVLLLAAPGVSSADWLPTDDGVYDLFSSNNWAGNSADWAYLSPRIDLGFRRLLTGEALTQELTVGADKAMATRMRFYATGDAYTEATHETFIIRSNDPLQGRTLSPGSATGFYLAEIRNPLFTREVVFDSTITISPNNRTGTLVYVGAGNTVRFEGNFSGTPVEVIPLDGSDVFYTDYGLTKHGNGTLVLSGSNTYIGETVLAKGILKLDFGAEGAPSANIINSASILRILGGELLVGAGEGLVSQAFAATYLSEWTDVIHASSPNYPTNRYFPGGYAEITVEESEAGVELALGLLHRDNRGSNSGGDRPANNRTTERGSTVNFNVQSDGNSKIFITTSATTAHIYNGLLVGGGTAGHHGPAIATVNRSEWATLKDFDDGQIGVGQVAAYQHSGVEISRLYTDWLASSNVSLQGDGSAVSVGANKTVNTLRIGDGSHLSVADNSTLTIASGGILLAGSGGIISGGNLTSGVSELVIFQHADTVSEISSRITGNIALVKSGEGTLRLTGSGAYTGLTILSGGVLEVEDPNYLGSSNRSLHFNGGTLRYVGTTPEGHRARIYLSMVGPAGGTIDASGVGPLRIGIENNDIFYGPRTDQPGQIATLVLTGTSTADNTILSAIGRTGGSHPNFESNHGSIRLIKEGSGTWVLGEAAGLGNMMYNDVQILGGALKFLKYNDLNNIRSNYTNFAFPANGIDRLLIDGGKLEFAGKVVETGTTYMNTTFTVGRMGATLVGSGEGTFRIINSGAVGFVERDYDTSITLEGINTGAPLTTSDPTIVYNQLGTRLTDNGTGKLSIIKRDSGVWVISSASNTYTGGTYVEDGVLRFSAARTIAAHGDIVVTGSGGQQGILEFSGMTHNVGGKITLDGGILREGVLNIQSGKLVELHSGTVESVVFTGGGVLSKTGTGAAVVNLANASTLAEVVVTGGHLSITGAFTTSGDGVNVGSGGHLTLNGDLTAGVNASGRVDGNFHASSLTVATGGVIAPGNSIGMIDGGYVTVLEAGGQFELELQAAGDGSSSAGVGWDLLRSELLFTGGESFTIRLASLNEAGERGGLAGWNPYQSQIWEGFIQFDMLMGELDAGWFVLELSEFSAYNLVLGEFSVQLNESNMAFNLVYEVAIPEASASLLVGLVGGIALYRRRSMRAA